ncbi:MAG: LLM class flavin-dependent oxidoreductase [Pseudomonadota bacterium]
MKFSLFYFDGDGTSADAQPYRLLLDSARFADEQGFEALWTPERHFHAFGGLYPNPAVTATALAMSTHRIQIRSGSVVLPLHHAVRVAEDWAMVDRLSGGRVGMGVASGWTMDEFVLAREPHGARRGVMWRSLEAVQRLWRGETVSFEDADGRTVDVRTLPRPLQPELPVWVACSSAETFVEAGRRGLNALTSLLGETVEQVADKVSRYRASLARHGHDPASRQVAIMVHTFMGDDLERVRDDVRVPFGNYLRTHYGLLDSLAKSMGLNVSLKDFSKDDLDSLLQYGVDGFMQGRSLIGTPESCLPFVADLRKAGVDEVCCLIDFIQDHDAVMGSLQHVARLRTLASDI